MTVRAYRVFPALPEVADDAPGGPRHVPAIQGAGRVDNPERYRVLYLADTAPAAVGEAFGDHRTWGPGLLAGRPSLPGSSTALAAFEVTGAVCDLDDPAELVERSIRPSRVVTRHRSTTQGWALRIFDEHRFVGVRWWSYWEPDWAVLGLWEPDAVTVLRVEPLTDDHPALREAAATLARPWG